jgi:hypothetical protein
MMGPQLSSYSRRRRVEIPSSEGGELRSHQQKEES